MNDRKNVRNLVAVTLGLLFTLLGGVPADARGGGGGGMRGGGMRGGGGARSGASRGSVRYSQPSRPASRPASRPSSSASRPASRPATRPSGGSPSRVAGPVSRGGTAARTAGAVGVAGTAAASRGRLPSIGSRVDALPSGGRELTHAGARYGFAGGRFYSPGDGGWTACRPPYGCRIPLLPPGSLRYYWGSRYYWGYAGCYYWHDDESDDYVTVEAPEGMIVSELPEGAVKELIDGKTYWRDGDTLYKPVYGTGGELMYQVMRL